MYVKRKCNVSAEVESMKELVLKLREEGRKNEKEVKIKSNKRAQ